MAPRGCGVFLPSCRVVDTLDVSLTVCVSRCCCCRSSGIGAFGGVGRCYPVWTELAKCSVRYGTGRRVGVGVARCRRLFYFPCHRGVALHPPQRPCAHSAAAALHLLHVRAVMDVYRGRRRTQTCACYFERTTWSAYTGKRWCVGVVVVTVHASGCVSRAGVCPPVVFRLITRMYARDCGGTWWGVSRNVESATCCGRRRRTSTPSLPATATVMGTSAAQLRVFASLRLICDRIRKCMFMYRLCRRLALPVLTL